MKKPILVVASQFAREIEDRIDRDYDPRRNPNTVPDRLDSNVFEGEPQIHPCYLELKNTFLLPHVGSATVETRVAMGCWPWTISTLYWPEDRLRLS